jgi:hypothetical protein
MLRIMLIKVFPLRKNAAAHEENCAQAYWTDWCAMSSARPKT